MLISLQHWTCNRVLPRGSDCNVFIPHLNFSMYAKEANHTMSCLCSRCLPGGPYHTIPYNSELRAALSLKFLPMELAKPFFFQNSLPPISFKSLMYHTQKAKGASIRPLPLPLSLSLSLSLSTEVIGTTIPARYKRPGALSPRCAP